MTECRSRPDRLFLRRLASHLVKIWLAMGDLGKAHCVHDIAPSPGTTTSSRQRPRSQRNDPEGGDPEAAFRLSKKSYGRTDKDRR